MDCQDEPQKYTGKTVRFLAQVDVYKRQIYIISGIGQGAGWASIMYTASLSNASKDLQEAAMIDGENLIQQIMTVEWPAIKDMVVIQFILQAGNIMSCLLYTSGVAFGPL